MKSLTQVFLAIPLMFILWLSVVAQARVLQPTSVTLLYSQNSFVISNSERVNASGSKQRAFDASLGRIPPSIPNPTQNK